MIQEDPIGHSLTQRSGIGHENKEKEYDREAGIRRIFRQSLSKKQS